MLSLLLALSSPAFAWKHTHYVWAASDFPIRWRMDDQAEDSLQAVADSRGVDVLELQKQMLQIGWDGWLDAECATWDESFVAIEPLDCAKNDGAYGFYWDDPCDMTEPGVLAVTYSYQNGVRQVINGESYFEFADADITYNDNVDWGVPEQIDGPSCTGKFSLEGVTTHEIGHSLGLGHSCEQSDICTEAQLEEATMYWSVDACEPGQDDINEDDILSLTTLYGPYGSFRAVGPRNGGTPLDVRFEIVSDTQVASASWDFGDGSAPSTEVNPTHTFTRKGQFTVSVDMELEDPTCGSYTYRASELAYVTACEPPAPAGEAEGFFTMEPSEGLVWKTLNHTDVTVYGCVDTIEWSVYRGTSESDIKPENLVDGLGALGAWSPLVKFPEAGDYVVVMNVGGPGGLTASYLAVSVGGADGGCATARGPASLAALGLAAMALVRRRRSHGR